MHGQPSLTFGANHIIDWAKWIGGKNARNTVGQLSPPFCRANLANTFGLKGGFLVCASFTNGKHGPLNVIHKPTT